MINEKGTLRKQGAFFVPKRAVVGNAFMHSGAVASVTAERINPFPTKALPTPVCRAVGGGFPVPRSAQREPPSDEGGAPQGRRERKLPLSHAVRMTAPLTRGAEGGFAAIGGLFSRPKERAARASPAGEVGRCQAARRGVLPRIPVFSPLSQPA